MCRISVRFKVFLSITAGLNVDYIVHIAHSFLIQVVYHTDTDNKASIILSGGH